MALLHSWEADAGCRQQASVPSHVEPHSVGLLECPHNMVATFPHSEGSKGAGESGNVLSHLASEVTFHLFCKFYLLTKVSLFSVEEAA